ncbi:hypothetical protein [Pannonibacter indicus]
MEKNNGCSAGQSTFSLRLRQGPLRRMGAAKTVYLMFLNQKGSLSTA